MGVKAEVELYLMLHCQVHSSQVLLYAIQRISSVPHTNGKEKNKTRMYRRFTARERAITY